KLETDESLLFGKAMAAISKYHTDAVVANLLQTRYDRVHIVIEIDEDREAEVVLDTRYRLSGPVRAAIKSVPGVEAVDF
ncbi:MAG: hypothetical protein ACPG4D_10500, partial [Alphaproteobacteria bacterium]